MGNATVMRVSHFSVKSQVSALLKDKKNSGQKIELTIPRTQYVVLQ